MSLLLPLTLMSMQVGVDPRGGQVPGVPEELRDRPPRGAAPSARSVTRPAIEVCLATARSEPAKARALAEEWVARTTGAQRATGRHCLGVAAGNGGDWATAGAAFLAAREEASEPRFRARMGALAGAALLAQDKPAEALAVLDSARAEAAAEAQLGGEIAQERAVALVALKREPEAGMALAEARRLGPDDANAWLLSATLARRQGDLATAQQQIERAAALDPRDPAVGLEAGVVAALSGNDAAARKSFESVIAAAPDSEQAATARAYLAQLKP
jgi:tetratricopeptide (TPR) repeat protein